MLKARLSKNKNSKPFLSISVWQDEEVKSDDGPAIVIDTNPCILYKQRYGRLCAAALYLLERDQIIHRYQGIHTPNCFF